jgi:hypothetical protein
MTIRTATYAHIVAVLKGVAEGMLPSVKFISATWDTISDETISTTEQVLIGLEQGFQLRRRSTDDNTEQGTIIVDIGLQDNYASDSVQQYNLLASADIIANQYIQELAAVSVAYGVQFSNIVKIPYYKKFGRVISGVGLQMDVSVNTCQAYEWGDLGEFAGAISAQVSPFDWANYGR